MGTSFQLHLPLVQVALFLKGDSLEKLPGSSMPIPSPTQLTPRGRELERRGRAGSKFREAVHDPGPTSREVQEGPWGSKNNKEGTTPWVKALVSLSLHDLPV